MKQPTTIKEIAEWLENAKVLALKKLGICDKTIDKIVISPVKKTRERKIKT